MSEIIKQYHSELKQIKSKNFSIDYLIKNTKVDVFNSDTFTGYQREINTNHYRKIVKYIIEENKKNNFLFPTPIICSERDSDSQLYIVDGQHRIEAFKHIKENIPELFEKIKDYEINTILLVNPSIKLEVDTFITINKTSKKVDTSLALIAKTLHSNFDDRENSAKKQFILVEVAKKMDDTKSAFCDNIAWEGTPQSTGKLISLNSFVRAYMPIINYLISQKLLDINDSTKLTDSINTTYEIIDNIWSNLEVKWPVLFSDKNSTIIKGTIGSSAIIKFINAYLKQLAKKGKEQPTNLEQLKLVISEGIDKITDDYQNWLPKGSYSNFSSGAGHSIIANNLLKSIQN
ncbi:DGQHR domain-containing protein [Streptococcus orisratti]